MNDSYGSASGRGRCLLFRNRRQRLVNQLLRDSLDVVLALGVPGKLLENSLFRLGVRRELAVRIGPDVFAPKDLRHIAPPNC